MKRKSYSLLAIGALLGAAATGFLVVTMLGDGHATVRSRNIGGQAPGTPTKQGADAGTYVVREGQHGSTRVPKGGPGNSTVRPGQREPFDGPSTVAERRKWSQQVLDHLEEIQTSNNSARKRDLYIQLQKLFRKLGHRVPESVRARLFEMLTTVDPQWRELVGDTIGNLRGDVDTARKLVALYKEKPENVRTRRAILRALEKMDVQEVVPDMLKMVRSGYENEDRIVEALGRIGGREVALGLFEHLGQDALNPRTRIVITSVLGNLKNPEVLEKMEKGLAEADARTATSYLNVLAETRNPKYAPAVLKIVDGESDMRARQAAIRALGFFGDAESGKKLLELVQSGNGQDKADATRAIQTIHDPNTIETLAKDWGRLSEDAQLATIGAGARLPQPPANLQKIAREALTNPNRRIRTQAAAVIGKRGNDSGVDDLVRYLGWADNSSEITTALQALRKIRTKKAAEQALRSMPRGRMTERQIKWYEEQFNKIIEQAGAPPVERR